MSDGRRDDRDAPGRDDAEGGEEPRRGEPRTPGDADPGLDTSETPGLGLTEEFARIEAEIGREAEGTERADDAAAERPAAADAAPDGEWAVERERGVGPDPGEHDDADWVGQRASADPAGPAAAEEPDDGEPESPGEGPVGHDQPETAGEAPAGDDDETEPTEQVPVDDEPEPAEPAAAPDPDPGATEAPGAEAEGPGAEEAGVGDEEDGSADVADEAPDEGADDEAPDEGAEVEAGAPAGPPTLAAARSGERPVVRPLPRPALPVDPGLTAIDEAQLDERTPSLWLRFLSGSVLIVASMATAVAVTGLLFLSDVAAKLQPIPGVQAQLQEVDPGAPQTILIIGSDRRAGTDKSDRRSDTTMLLRVDPEKKILSLFSLPRDLKVDIPGYGPAKLNEAYTLGGEKKTLKTVHRFTGLDINHVVEINFQGFADAVNAIDCVYIDVDRHYFNDNAGVAPGTDQGYAEIDISAGYQRLCGLKALQYVRYRHTDTDLVRAARQQDFLREARQKVQPRELLGAVFGTGTGNELIDIFTKYTRSDIGDKNDMIGILKSFVNVRDVPVNEVHFEGDIGGPDNPYVTSTDKQVKTAIDQFLNGVGSQGQRGGKQATEKDGKHGGGKSKKKSKKKKDLTAKANVVSTDSLADAKFPTLAERFQKDAEKNARRLGIPVFYPTEVVPGSSFNTDSRTYEYKNEDDKKESAYKTVIALTNPSTLVEYYGVMGTTWDDPPILRNPSETRKIDGREYLLFYDGDRLRLVGWKDKGNSYWLNNTLVQSIGEAEMLAIATSMREA